MVACASRTRIDWSSKDFHVKIVHDANDPNVVSLFATSMDDSQSKLISGMIRKTLETGSTAALLTVIGSGAESMFRVGDKLIVNESGERVGSLGDLELDDAVARSMPAFLKASNKTKAFK